MTRSVSRIEENGEIEEEKRRRIWELSNLTGVGIVMTYSKNRSTERCSPDKCRPSLSSGSVRGQVTKKKCGLKLT